MRNNNLSVVQIPKIYIAVQFTFNIFITTFMQIMNLLTSPMYLPSLSIDSIVKILYFWSYKYPNHIVVHETGNEKTIIDFYNFCHEVCSVILQEHSEPIGGQEKSSK